MDSEKKTWIAAAICLAGFSLIIGFIFELKILSFSVSTIVLMGILLLVAVWVLIASYKSLGRLNGWARWLSRLLALLTVSSVVIVSLAVILISEKTVYFQFLHDFYFCSGNKVERRKEKWQTLLERQFKIIDESNIPEPELMKLDILSSLGHTYESEAQTDRINRLTLAHWFYQLHQEKLNSRNGPSDSTYEDPRIRDIHAKLQKAKLEESKTLK